MLRRWGAAPGRAPPQKSYSHFGKVIRWDRQCPTPPAMLPGMKQPMGFCPVKLEPELEEVAALWPAAKRLAVARKFKRWARQLKVSAVIMLRREPSSPPCRPRVLKFVAPLKAVLN